MGSIVSERLGGLRRYNQFNAAVERIARGYDATETTSPTVLLGKLKRAAPYMPIQPNVVALIDKLVSHSRKQDWKPGRTPIVWPSNEELMLSFDVSKRTVQNWLRQAIEAGLIVPRDSQNGHRGGLRDAAGNITWAYGFDLSPLGARAAEFDAIAAAGIAEGKEITRLRNVIQAARRRARMLGLAVEENEIDGIDPTEALEFVRMAVAHVSGSRSIDQLIRCAAQVTAQVNALQEAVDAVLIARASTTSAWNDVNVLVDVAPAGAPACTHSTTTIKPESAKAVTRRRLSRLSSGSGVDTRPRAASGVEADLDRHGIDPAFIARACPEIIWDLDLGPRAWGRLTSIAEQLADQHDISLHAWREACRVMGTTGAAAAVIATVHKAVGREVRNPGAYLRGMSQRASKGELHLGRTFHRLREQAAMVQ